VINALTAVEVLAAGGGEMGLVQISTALGLDPAQVRRILQQLMADGWVSQSGDAARYRFGTRMLTLSGRILGNLDISRAGQAVMRELRDDSGETVHLGLLRESRVVCIARELSTHSVVAVATAVGDVWPLQGSAMGTAVRGALLGPPDPARREDAEAAEARDRGYSIDLGGHKGGIVGLAAPVLDYRGAPDGAIAVSGPENRMGPARIGEVGRLVTRAAAQLSAALGHPASGTEIAE
jgi:DNA-binding IclR family transcriptional regulator